MAMVVNLVNIDDEDHLDVAFWLTKTPTERIAEVTRLRVKYYIWLNGSYPEKMEKVVTSRSL